MTQLSSVMYRPGSSLLHGLDAAVKLICFMLLCAAIVLTGTAAGYVAMLIFTPSLAYMARLNVSQATSGVRRLRWMLLAIILLKFLFACPEKAFFRWWIFALSLEGLAMGAAIAIKLSLILVLTATVSATTSSIRLSEGLRTLLHPLSKLKLPADHIALMLGVTMRFVPQLFREADNIRYAQRARGMKFEKQGFFDTARAAVPIAVPLCVSAFRKAESLSVALEAKGYRMDGRGVSVEKIRPGRGDWYALFVCAAVFALQVIIL